MIFKSLGHCFMLTPYIGCDFTFVDCTYNSAWLYIIKADYNECYYKATYVPNIYRGTQLILKRK